jgi:hypothetical protein
VARGHGVLRRRRWVAVVSATATTIEIRSVLALDCARQGSLSRHCSFERSSCSSVPGQDLGDRGGRGRHAVSSSARGSHPQSGETIAREQLQAIAI